MDYHAPDTISAERMIKERKGPRPIRVFGATLGFLVGFGILYQHFGFLLIILGPLLFVPLFLWFFLYSPLLLIPAAHYQPDHMNIPFLSLPPLLIYSSLLAGVIVTALFARGRPVRMAAMGILALLAIHNLLGAYRLLTTDGQQNKASLSTPAPPPVQSVMTIPPSTHSRGLAPGQV